MASGPLRGIYLEYYSGIGKDVRVGLTQAEFDALKGPEKYERVLLKEAIGKFLGLTPAAPRFGVFNPNSSATNAGTDFAYRKQKGSKPFKVGLMPSTIIPQRYGQRNESGQWEIVADNTRQPAEFQMSLPRTCSVSEVIKWMMAGTIVDEEGNETSLSSGGGDGGGGTNTSPFERILYIITPAGRKHPLRGLFEESRLEEPEKNVNEPGQKPETSSAGGGGDGGGT